MSRYHFFRAGDTARSQLTTPLKDVYAVRSILERVRGKLVRHFIFAPSVYDVMRQEGLFTHQVLHVIRSERDNERKVKRMIDFLKYENAGHFNKFLRVLRKSGHSWLAEEIDKEYLHYLGLSDDEEDDDDDYDRESLYSEISSVDRHIGDRHYGHHHHHHHRRPHHHHHHGHDTSRSVVLPPSVLDYQRRNSYPLRRQEEQECANANLGSFVMHYNQEKNFISNKLHFLRKEEQAIRDMLSENGNKQIHYRRRYGQISSMNRELGYVAAKNLHLAKSM